MVNGIKKVLSPLLIISSVVGFRRFGYSPSQTTFWFSSIYISTLWLIYVFITWYYLPIFLRELAWSDSAHIPNFCLNVLITFMATIIGLCNEKECLKRIAAVDDTLEALGVLKDYSKEYKIILRSVVVWFTIACITTITDTWLTTWKKLEFFGHVLWLILVADYNFYINGIIDLNFGVLLECMSTRLDRVNERIQKLVDEKTYKRGRFQERLFLSSRNPVNDEKNKRVLWTAMHLHLEICKISRVLNTVYEVQTLLEMISLFMTLVAQFVYFYRSGVVVRHGIFYAIIYYLVNVQWVAMCIGKLYYINDACDRASSKANTAKEIMDKAINGLHNIEDQKDMTQFTFQIMHNPLKFTAMGFFNFGHGFMHQLLISVTTVVIIMLQMDAVPKIRGDMQYKGNNETSIGK